MSATRQTAPARFHFFESDIDVAVLERFNQASIPAATIIALACEPRKKARRRLSIGEIPEHVNVNKAPVSRNSQAGVQLDSAYEMETDSAGVRQSLLVAVEGVVIRNTECREIAAFRETDEFGGRK
jgi:hypothetical protein